MEKYYRKIPLGIKDLTLLATLRMYHHTYCIWQACKRIDRGDATALYADFWKRDAEKSFAATMKGLHMETVPDVKALGEIVAYATTCAPSLYVTKISNENLHVGYVIWCGNPGILKIPNVNELKQKLRLGEVRSKEEWVDTLLAFGLSHMLIPCSKQERIANGWKYAIDLSQFKFAVGTHSRARQYLTDVMEMVKGYIFLLIQEGQLDGVTLHFPDDQQDYDSWLVEVRC